MGSEEKTLYNYTSVKVNELKRSDIPRRLVTDCSGFVSWVIRQGCGQKGRDVYDKLWAKSAKTPETWRGRNKQPRIRAIGFYNAFTHDGGGRWSSPQALTDARKGDMLVYTIDKSIHKCKSLNGRPVKDSGHIMIIVGIPFRDAYPGNTARCSGLTRYKFKVVDSSKAMHYAGRHDTDSRMRCFRKKTFGKKTYFDKLPGCGVGTGWIYAWTHSNGTIASVGLRPPADNPLQSMHHAGHMLVPMSSTVQFARRVADPSSL